MKKISLLLVLVGCSVTKEEIRLGVNWEKLSIGQFSERRNFGIVVVDGKIIVIGGYIKKDSGDILANDVWISEDERLTWTQIKTNTENPTEIFTKRQKFGTVVISNEIYIIGRYSDTGSHFNDICKSSDLGKTWTEIKKNTEFTPRYGHKAVVIGNDIYI